MSSSTPSPTAPGTPGTTASNSRRPPRKSTLTQQQKNQKRQRATQDQLVTLEVEFNKNPTPTAAVRERIAQDINMTERSVQIWFQNRRAKIKLIAKKSIENGEDCDEIPESMRQYLAIQAIESGKPLMRGFSGRSGGPISAYGHGGMLLSPDKTSDSKVVISHFQCRSLSIGTWRRVGQNAMDLVVFYSPVKACFTYYINNDSAGYKIEFPFAYIKNITLENGTIPDETNGAATRPGGLLIELNRPPNFFMDSSLSGGFYQCGDFTEDQQASRIMVHHLGGSPNVLSGQLAKLISLESFQTRHNPFDPHAMAASAPVSPIGHRPSSQPNQMSHPHMALFHESSFGTGLRPGGRGHKRTRSKSVPAAIDYSMLRSPMPSFHVQHPSTTIMDPNIFAPVPQHHNNLTPIGPSLRIDTSSGYGMDFRPYPMSAATTTSPSEYASPSFFTSGSQMDHMPTSHFNTNCSLSFLSPMPEHPNINHPSGSPLTAINHGDPIIAGQSPPLTSMHRSASADFLSMSQNHQSNISEDGLMLNVSEMYSKHNLNLPMHSPGVEASGLGMQIHDEPSNEEMDMHNMLSFGTIDPSNLGTDNTDL